MLAESDLMAIAAFTCVSIAFAGVCLILGFMSIVCNHPEQFTKDEEPPEGE